MQEFKEYPNSNYAISNDGIVLNTKSNYLLKPNITTNGYYRISFNYNGTASTKLVHRLIAELFIPNPHNYQQVNHIDGNKLNNHVSNLEWCNSAYNVQHAFKTGLNASKVRKFTNDDCSEIIEAYEAGIKQVDIARHYGVNPECIHKIIKGKTYNYIDTIINKKNNENR